tara:strand:+ start:55 stop:300 length:246 start_codon:yes stop_codon:yes gene_type:complete
MITKEYTEKIQYVDYDSSTVKSTEYNYQTGLLTVFFNTNKYEYHNVSLEDYESLRNANSQGKALNEIIKGTYEYQKIDDLV